ncbi:MAG: hypothetical protein KDE53_04680 [Caldilineaceae bacterium]|nr:hypothetical protein [Caldilineaceae bacterium]
MTIQVYFNAGENANRPWTVGLHDGISIVEIFGKFATPISAIRCAFDETPMNLPVFWPEWLKVVVA